MDKINKIVKATVAIAAAACMAASLVNAATLTLDTSSTATSIIIGAGAVSVWDNGTTLVSIVAGDTGNIIAGTTGRLTAGTGAVQSVTLNMTGGNITFTPAANTQFAQSLILNMSGGNLTMAPTTATHNLQIGNASAGLAGKGYINVTGGTMNLTMGTNSAWGGILFANSINSRDSYFNIGGTAAVTCGWLGSTTNTAYGIFTFSDTSTTTVNADMTINFIRQNATYPLYGFVFSGGTVSVGGNIAFLIPRTTDADNNNSFINFTLNSTAILEAGSVRGVNTLGAFEALWNDGYLHYDGHDRLWHEANSPQWLFTDYFSESVVGGKLRLTTLAIPEPTTWALLGASLLVVTLFRRRK